MPEPMERETIANGTPARVLLIEDEESVADAIHVQPGTTVTAIEGPAPPPAATVAETGFSDPAHETA